MITKFIEEEKKKKEKKKGGCQGLEKENWG